MADRNEEKRIAAVAAVAEIEAGMVVGLGTGTTAAFAIAALGRRVADGLRVTAAGTSLDTERKARAAGIAMIAFEDVGRVDLAIDGADEIDPAFRAIKGGGGAMVREKIIAASATRMICIVDAGKPVPRLARALPIEVLPFARAFVGLEIARLGGDPVLRVGAGGAPVLSDQSNLLIDCAFGPIADPAALAVALDAVPGLVGHGLFLTEVDALFVGSGDEVRRHERHAE
ncbi:MAG TPA: ribose-5-phosphate isomerase RpiA [Sphingomonas sp.]